VLGIHVEPDELLAESPELAERVEEERTSESEPSLAAHHSEIADPAGLGVSFVRGQAVTDRDQSFIRERSPEEARIEVRILPDLVEEAREPVLERARHAPVILERFPADSIERLLVDSAPERADLDPRGPDRLGRRLRALQITRHDEVVAHRLESMPLREGERRAIVHLARQPPEHLCARRSER